MAFGAAIMHEPSVLFLDEPTSGVDPLARRAFWTMINRLADAGTAILVTTHYLEEAEQCNRLGLMVAGEFVAEGSPSGVKARQTGHLLEFVVDQPQRAADFLKAGNERWRVSLFGDRLHIITDETPEKAIAATTEKLRADGIRVLEAREGRFSLEDVFISVVEKARQQGKCFRRVTEIRVTRSRVTGIIDAAHICTNSKRTDPDCPGLPDAHAGAGASAGLADAAWLGDFADRRRSAHCRSGPG